MPRAAAGEQLSGVVASDDPPAALATGSGVVGSDSSSASSTSNTELSIDVRDSPPVSRTCGSDKVKSGCAALSFSKTSAYLFSSRAANRVGLDTVL